MASLDELIGSPSERIRLWRRLRPVERRAVQVVEGVFPGARLAAHWRYRKVKARPVREPVVERVWEADG